MCGYGTEISCLKQFLDKLNAFQKKKIKLDVFQVKVEVFSNQTAHFIVSNLVMSKFRFLVKKSFLKTRLCMMFQKFLP